MPDPTPAQPAADRNLPFGILALQMAFISRDALIGAMNAWVLDKAKPLGQLLVEQQALAPEERDVLKAVVRVHLKAHHDDPHASLASLSSVSDARRALGAIADADVQARAIGVLAETVDPHDARMLQAAGDLRL